MGRKGWGDASKKQAVKAVKGMLQVVRGWGGDCDRAGCESCQKYAASDKGWGWEGVGVAENRL